jgi:hypothetical protein
MSNRPINAPSSRHSDRVVGAGAGENGWITFAGIVMFLNGVFGALYGLAAVLNDQVVTVGARGVVIGDFTAWGWIEIAIGVGMATVAVGLFTANPLARWLAVGFAMVHAIAQFGILTAFPLWAILVITLDIVIIYQLVTRWEPV